MDVNNKGPKKFNGPWDQLNSINDVNCHLYFDLQSHCFLGFHGDQQTIKWHNLACQINITR